MAEAASVVWCAEGNAASVEEFGLAENLMCAVAIEDASGAFVTQDVPAGRMLSDLTGFRRCLELARRLLPRVKD